MSFKKTLLDMLRFISKVMLDVVTDVNEFLIVTGDDGGCSREYLENVNDYLYQNTK